MKKWLECVERVIGPEEKYTITTSSSSSSSASSISTSSSRTIAELKAAARFDGPKFNITRYVGIYPVADLLMFQDAIYDNEKDKANGKGMKAFRLRQN